MTSVSYPTKRPINETDITSIKKIEESLYKFDPTLHYYDLKCLNLAGWVRKPSKHNWKEVKFQDDYFKHSKYDLYLRQIYNLVTDEYKWIDVTKDYDWEQIFLNRWTPFEEFKITKTTSDRFDDILSFFK